MFACVYILQNFHFMYIFLCTLEVNIQISNKPKIFENHWWMYLSSPSSSRSMSERPISSAKFVFNKRATLCNIFILFLVISPSWLRVSPYTQVAPDQGSIYNNSQGLIWYRFMRSESNCFHFKVFSHTSNCASI